MVINHIMIMPANTSNKIVFHGTSLPPGTITKSTLKAPSLQNPFFVASSPSLANFYLDISPTSSESEGSVYVIMLADSPEKISLNLYRREGIEALGKKLPVLASSLKRWAKKAMGSEKSLRDFSHELAGPLIEKFRPDIFDDLELPLSNELPDNEIVDVLHEIGLVSGEMENLVVTDNYLKDILESANADECGHAVTRRIKASVNKAAYDMGYLMVGDYDTSGTDMTQHEYAILDLRAIEAAIGTTVAREEVSAAKKALISGNAEFSHVDATVNQRAYNILVQKRRQDNYFLGSYSIPKYLATKVTILEVPEKYRGGYLHGLYSLEEITFPKSMEYFTIGFLKGCKKIRKIIFKGVKFNNDEDWEKRFGEEVHDVWITAQLPDGAIPEIIVPRGFCGNLDTARKMGCKVTVL